MAKSKSGRLVKTHSTYVDGLIPILQRLTHYPGIQTVTPAVIERVKGHSPHLKLRVSTPIRGGFKLLARRGKSCQEVFVLTSLDQAELEARIAEAIAG